MFRDCGTLGGEPCCLEKGSPAPAGAGPASAGLPARRQAGRPEPVFTAGIEGPQLRGMENTGRGELTIWRT